MIHRTGKRAKHTTQPYTAVSSATNGSNDAMDQDDEMMGVWIKYRILQKVVDDNNALYSNPRMRL